MRHVIGIDLGGTKTAGGIVDAGGNVVFSFAVPTPSQSGADEVLETAARLTRSLLEEAGLRGLAVEGLGIGAAGVIDSVRGVVTSATDAILGWAGTELTAELTARTGLPAAALNDVHAHALGESWLGAGAGVPSVLFIGMGTGVGGSYVLDGRPIEGASFTAGHVGHLASPFAYEAAEPLPCSCGAAGHVEAIASGPGIFALYTRLGGTTALDTREVYRLAADGDPVAAEALRRGAEAAGSAVGGLANVLDPAVVVVGGGLAFAGPLWWDAMERTARGELLRPLIDLPIVPARLGETAAIRGAARRALSLIPVSEGSHA
ncbi:ROK family protein [Arthrobacter sp. zg-Y411]|uniref:ROK family protein n=1 Tax=Arthrobacter TaxID=1663 RepID=UPI001D134D8F|nr:MULTISPECIES: ROK family protein [Arthrobacter]MCC3295638.1 ROK family protein [Arthrobacter zhangbolii]MDN3905855.1 ROK family protein [Arthrobacter sp. YD2]